LFLALALISGSVWSPSNKGLLILCFRPAPPAGDIFNIDRTDSGEVALMLAGFLCMYVAADAGPFSIFTAVASTGSYEPAGAKNDGAEHEVVAPMPAEIIADRD